MRLLFLFLTFSVFPYFLISQIPYTIEGTVVDNRESGTWYGVNIPRIEPTKLVYRYNSITSMNRDGYLLQAGDENPSPRDNHLDNMEIIGNLFHWKGENDPSIITHGLFTGYNINSIIKYNYLINNPYGIIFKSGNDEGENMTFTSGGCAYNICKNGKFAVRMKGINGVKIYNNTFYSGDDDGRYLVLITSNQDRIVPSPSTGSKVFNNIFYSKNQIPMISIESGSLEGFESDYNLFWCTKGEPVFSIDGKIYTFQQWRELGYDTHSKIVDPNFNNTTDFIPSERLDFGTDLGNEWKTGLSTIANWVPGVPLSTVNQSGTWQVGARIREKIEKPDSIGSESFNIFPNPSNGKFKLSIPVIPDEGLIVEITNLNGQKLVKQTINESITDWTINLNSGTIFFITLRGSNIHETKKIILNNSLD